MYEVALPVAEVGTWKGETSARYGRLFDFRGIGILHHRLSEPVVQRGGQKGVRPESSRGWRKIRCAERSCEAVFSRRDKAGKRLRLMSNACYIKSIFGQTSANGMPVLINSNNKLGTSSSSKRV